jgi:hypothetical protein
MTQSYPLPPSLRNKTPSGLDKSAESGNMHKSVNAHTWANSYTLHLEPTRSPLDQMLHLGALHLEPTPLPYYIDYTWSPFPYRTTLTTRGAHPPGAADAVRPLWRCAPSKARTTYIPTASPPRTFPNSSKCRHALQSVVYARAKILQRRLAHRSCPERRAHPCKSECNQSCVGGAGIIPILTWIIPAIYVRLAVHLSTI